MVIHFVPYKWFSNFHHRSSLLGECTNCGVESLKICAIKLSSNRHVTWWKLIYVVGKTSDGHDKKVSMVEYCETNPSHLIGFLKPKL
jgi:hypothetical protein